MYIRKTTDEWTVQGFYGSLYGWEDLSCSDSFTEARDDIKSYRDNEPQYRYRLVKTRIPKESTNA